MNGSAIAIWIGEYSIWIALIIIILFLVYQFLIKPRFKKESFYQPQIESPKDDKPENPTTRMGRGFKEMYKKIQESDYVKGMQEEQENSSFDDFLPNELKENYKQSAKKGKTPDPFSMKF